MGIGEATTPIAWRIITARMVAPQHLRAGDSMNAEDLPAPRAALQDRERESAQSARLTDAAAGQDNAHG